MNADETPEPIHCAGCKKVIGYTHGNGPGYGHMTSDQDGGYLRCQEPERYERSNARRRSESEVRERAELARLQAKYGGTTAESQRDTLRTALIEAQSWIEGQPSSRRILIRIREALEAGK